MRPGLYRSLSAGSGFNCAVLQSGAVECWRGLIEEVTRFAPGGHSDAVEAGGSDLKPHACALRDSGELACWGSKDSGQIDAWQSLAARYGMPQLWTDWITWDYSCSPDQGMVGRAS